MFKGRVTERSVGPCRSRFTHTASTRRMQVVDVKISQNNTYTLAFFFNCCELFSQRIFFLVISVLRCRASEVQWRVTETKRNRATWARATRRGRTSGDDLQETGKKNFMTKKKYKKDSFIWEWRQRRRTKQKERNNIEMKDVHTNKKKKKGTTKDTV